MSKRWALVRAYALYKQPTLRNGLVLVGDVVILAGGRLAHEAVKGLTAGPKPKPPTWAEFIESVAEFKGGARPELARQSHDLFIAGKWAQLETLFKQNNINGGWPPNRGFSAERETTLKAEDKTIFDRYGGYKDRETGEFTDKGTFAAPEKVPFEQRGLQEATKDKPYNRYQVIKDIPGVKEGPAIPWFGQPGKGTQYELPKNINDLIAEGYIKKLP